jgi:pimeloyl-ACP methyl ester carboxylesterase
MTVLVLVMLTVVVPSAAAQPVPDRYRTQVLDWQPCGSPPALECAFMTVPVDWTRPGRSGDLQVYVSRLRATGPARRGVLFTNPGGPGVPGWTIPLFWHFVKPRITAIYDVIGFDPRGVGRSTPVRCDGIGVQLPADVRDRSAETLAELRTRAKAVVDHCVQPAGELARYINTFQTVRDMDLLRDLLREPKVSYWGGSAGTWLGAWYATEFPRHVDRFVFDGNVDFSTSWYRWQRLRPRAFQRAFEVDFLPWIARYQDVYRYGGTAGAARATWEARRAALARTPLVVAPDCTIRATDFDQGAWQAMVNPRLPGGFVDLARGLSIVERFEVATPEERQFVYDFFPCVGPPAPPGHGTRDQLALVGTLCGDTPSPDFARYNKDAKNLGRRYPLLGWFADVITGYCAFWPFPPTGAPRIDGRQLPPILMVNSERDPATPIEGARAAAHHFAAGRLLVVADDGEHVSYGLNPCADTATDDFLINGTLPAHGTTCPGLPLPVPPGATGLSAATAGQTPLHWLWQSTDSGEHPVQLSFVSKLK